MHKVLSLSLLRLSSLLCLAAGVAGLHAQPFVYVANLRSNSVSVIDTVNQNVVATIGVGLLPWGIAVTPDGTRAYVADAGDTILSVLDTVNNTHIGIIVLPIQPIGVAVAPDGRRVYVVGSDSVVAIDTSTNRIVATTPVPAAFWAAVNPTSTRAYTSNSATGTMSVLDAATNQVVANVPVGEVPQGLAVSPDGRRVYVANMNSGDVSVIDTLTNAIQATVPVQCCPISVAISPSGDRVFVARHQGFQGELDVIDTATNTVVSSLPLSQEAEDVKLIPSGSQAYVTNPFANAVTAIDIAAMQVLAVIPVGVLPLRLAIGPAVIGPEPAPRVIHVDIKPQDPSNTINPKSGGTIRVALLSTPEFPLFIPFSGTLINWVDFTSLRFGRTGTEESLVSCNSNGEDVNKDGLLDLICHFDIQRAGFQPGDTVGILNAKVFDGISLTGSDSVRIVP